MISAVTGSHEAGAIPGAGTFSCAACGFQVSLEALDELPECPRCTGVSFRRASLFEIGLEQPSTTEFAVADEIAEPEWLPGAREAIEEPGRYLAFSDGGLHLCRLEHGWTRIGRSVAADIRLDDPTVSRRHALIVWEKDEPLRVMDDRSLNGVFLNGEMVDWGSIGDGDELAVGRYRLYLLEV